MACVALDTSCMRSIKSRPVGSARVNVNPILIVDDSVPVKSARIMSIIDSVCPVQASK
jgi:hypothetical protein